MNSSGIELRPNGTAISVTNHYTGWVAAIHIIRLNEALSDSSCHHLLRCGERFMNTQLTDMHLINGLAEGNARAAERLYHEMYPHRQRGDRSQSPASNSTTFRYSTMLLKTSKLYDAQTQSNGLSPVDFQIRLDFFALAVTNQSSI
ncbi:hypothetical protein TNCV_448151 [Trichonephila clavipes]|nr:hypothetical protein TNCV_448151 [Trichonephila clavipes]